MSTPALTLTSAVTSISNARRIALLVMVLSGFAALGYQGVWIQQCTLWLGHDAASVLAVVAAFFGGVSLGASLLGSTIARSRQPIRWYAACELAIALWCGVLIFAIEPTASALQTFTGIDPTPVWQWTVAFFGTFVLLLPATAAMGATLPAMERVLTELQQNDSNIATLYAANTFGAVAGVVATTFVLIPSLGLAATTAICAVLNVGVALIVLYSWPSRSQSLRSAPLAERSSTRRASASALLAMTGLLGIGYEIGVLRVLTQLTENTVYTYAILLAVYLVGTALGAAAYERLQLRLNRSNDDLLLLSLGVACLLGTASLPFAQPLHSWLIEFAHGMPAAFAVEALLAVIAFLLPTIAMGTVFSHLSERARLAGITFGSALGVNTLGAALAPLIFGVCLLPLIGPRWTLIGISMSYLFLGALSNRSAVRWIAVGAAMALAYWLPTLKVVDVRSDGRLTFYKDGITATVSVVEDAQGIATLHINNRQQEGSNATRLADAKQALLPLLLHPAPKQALFLGLGTGVTASAAATDPNLRVDAVELLPEVIEASRLFVPDNSRTPTIVVADARRYVRVASTHYDVIVADNFHPARSGSAALYTVEHFTAIRNRLASDGVFCQWLPLHQLDIDTLRSIVRTFQTVFPHGLALLSTYSLETPVVGLIARAGDTPFDMTQLQSRLRTSARVYEPTAFGIHDELALLGHVIAGPQALARFSISAPLNTDDHPIVAYLAPRETYAPTSKPSDRLLALLKEVAARDDEVLSSATDDLRRRLNDYWIARNRFIEAGKDIRPSRSAQQMLAQIQAPLLAVLNISPEFRPAYDPLLRMAIALRDVDPIAARELLRTLHELQPMRSDTESALR